MGCQKLISNHQISTSNLSVVWSKNERVQKHPFGIACPATAGLMSERSSNSESYRYEFQGQEKDDEVSGEGNSYTAEFWQYDSRLGRRWNIDPVVKHHESPYAAFGNNPIWFVDPSGADTTKAEKLVNLGELSEKFKTSLTRYDSNIEERKKELDEVSRSLSEAKVNAEVMEKLAKDPVSKAFAKGAKGVVESLELKLKIETAKLNKIIADRNELVEKYNTAVAKLKLEIWSSQNIYIIANNPSNMNIPEPIYFPQTFPEKATGDFIFKFEGKTFNFDNPYVSGYRHIYDFNNIGIIAPYQPPQIVSFPKMPKSKM